LLQAELKESRECAAEMARQRDEAFTRNGLLQAELAGVRAEVRRDETERLALIADHRREQAVLEEWLRERESLEKKSRADLEQQFRLEQDRRSELQSQYEHERLSRIALLNSYSWRITGPLRWLYDISNRVRRSKVLSK
jgi:hypothetical protein